MPLTAEIMQRILPEGRPDWVPRTSEEDRKASLLKTRDGGEGPWSRGYFWQKHLTELLREYGSWLSDSLTARGFPNPELDQAVGYIEVDASIADDDAIIEASKGTGYFFGAVLYDHRMSEDRFERPRVDFGSLDERSRGIIGARIPAADVTHAPHPSGAMAACWAASRSDGQVKHVLTAKHAVAGLAKLQRVAMAGGGFGRLVNYCEGAVDAAIIESPSHPAAPTALGIDADPAIGLDIMFTGAGSRIVLGKISKTWIFPGNSDPYDAQRVHFDCVGAPGDSGALVRLTATAEAVGLYTGIKAGLSTQSGMSQAIWQATELLDIDLFE